MHIPVVSTAHITKGDCDLLENSPADLQVFCNYEEGFIISILEDERLTEFSYAFRSLMDQFRNLGYKWLRLDRDGDILNGLSEHSW